MQKLYKDKLPQWFKEDKRYELILSDDIDSLASCMVLKEVKNWNIEYFYNFKGMGKTKRATENVDNQVGVDIALCNGKTFDNHVVKLHREDEVNPLSINFNVMEEIHRGKYFQKYCGSTLLLVWSLFDLPLPKSEEGKMILLAIDSTQSGYYSTYDNDKRANKHYLCNVLEFEELYEVLGRHKSHEFAKLYNKYSMGRHNGKIIADKGKLTTNLKLDELSKELGIPLELPTDLFYNYKEFDLIEHELAYSRMYSTKRDDVVSNPYSLAVTGQNYVKYSTEREG